MSSAVTPPPKNRPRRVRRSSSPRPFVVTSTSSSSTRRVSASRSRASATSATTTGSSSRRPSSRRSRALRRGVDRLELARRRGRRPRARWMYRGRPGRFRRRMPRQRRDGSDPEAEVVVSAPVAEVVPRAKVAPTRTATLEAEVRGLVPAVAGRAERVDDLLEVALHRVGLPRELVAVRVREARPGLRLELVARQVLRLEREGLGSDRSRDRRSSGRECRRGDRARCCRIRHHGECAPPDGRRPESRAARARLEQIAAGTICAPSETRVTPVARRARATSGGHRLWIRLDRRLARGWQRTRAAARARASSVNVGVPPPRNTVSRSSASTSRSCPSSASSAST